MDRPRRQRRRGRSRSRRAPARDGLARGDSDASVPGGACAQSRPELVELSPFSVFCAILGITETDGYARQEHTAVARRFGMTDDELSEYLRQHRLSAADLCDGSFDLESARLDIKVAPEGISRVELARTLYEEFRSEQGG